MPEPKRPLKVFLCHASQDKPKVRELYRTLRRRGMQPWLDAEDLIPGQNWEVEIPRALYSSDAIIICLSPNSVDKEGYVQKEIGFALDKALEMPEGRIFLIPAKLEECELPLRLRQYQAVNLYEKVGYVRLMKALKLRASQLERATVELPKKDIEEENFANEKAAREKQDRETVEKDTRERKAKEFREKQSRDARQKAQRESEKIASQKKEEKTVIEKPRATTQIAYWLGGFAVLILAMVLLSSFNNPAQSSEPTPENTQSQIASTSTFAETIEPSSTPTLETTLTPAGTLTPTPLPTEITDSTGVSMVLVPAGEFAMGSDFYDDTMPVHKVYLDDFYMDVYEVTNAIYKACVDAGVCTPPKSDNSNARPHYYGNSQFEDYPVIFVNWDQAKTYCEQWRNAYLPNEAEWEKAARGPNSNFYPWGWDNPNETLVNFDGNRGDTTEVGDYEEGRSFYGLYDMAGNVWEWVADWYDAYSGNTISNSAYGTKYRVARGGSWSDFVVHSDRRRGLRPDDGYATVGFRCAKEATP